MPQIALGLATSKRQTTWRPEFRLVNWLAEKNEANTFSGVDLIQRPGLAPFATVGTGPIRGLFRQAGTFGGDFVSVSDDELYRTDDIGVSTLVGSVPGSLRTTFAATASRMLVVSDTVAFSTTGASVTTIAMPDSRPVSSVAQLNGYFILAQQDSARFYWIEPGQTDPDGLSFATTESTPGNIRIVVRVGDELWFLKEEGTEVWVPTGDADLPFQRVPGRNYDRGCMNGDTAVRFDNSLAFVGNDGVVYRASDNPIRISDNALEEQIRKSSVDSMRAWSFAFDGHSLYVLTMDAGTYAYDASSGLWSEFSSYERDAWRAHVGDQGETFVVAGDDETGQLWRLDEDRSTDGVDVMVRQATGGVPVNAGPKVRCNSLEVMATTGTAADPNLYPKMRISWSDDGETFGSFEDVSIGRQGHYGEPVRLNRLGVMGYPGRLFRFQVTDDAYVTLKGAAYNEPAR